MLLKTHSQVGWVASWVSGVRHRQCVRHIIRYHCNHYRDRYVDRDRVGRLGEMQTSLNVIWKAKPQGTTVSRLIARAASLGLVAALGFLLMVSLVVSIVLTAFGNYLDSILPFGKLILTALNVVVSITLISFLFAAIYKVLPDGTLEWGDVVVGAVVTAVLFTIGKSLISWYIGSSAVASSFGAAGG